MATMNSPSLTNKIRDDVPAINTILKAIAKSDPSALEGIENGTKRIVTVDGRWCFQEYIGGSWVTRTSFNIDATSVNGKTVSASATAGTIPVRDSDGKLTGDITGNAETATTATSLASTLSLSEGGTGATTASAARSALGVPPTSHASTGTSYGISTANNYGHAKASATTPTALGTAAVGSETAAFARGDHVHPTTTASDSVLGMVKLSNSALSTSGTGDGFAATPQAVNSVYNKVVEVGNTATSAVTAAATAQTTADSALAKADTSVQTSGNQIVGGAKTFTSIPYIKGNAPGLYFQDTNLNKGTPDTNANNDFTLNFFDKNGTSAVNRIGSIIVRQDKNGNSAIGLYAYKDAADSTTNANLAIVYPKSGNPYAMAPTPDASANGTHIATTAWVRANTLANVSVTTSASVQAERKMQIDGYTGIASNKRQNGVNADDYQSDVGSGAFSVKRAEIRTTNTIGAGTYTMQNLLVELAKRAHTHQTGAWLIKSNCDCDCNCCDAY